MADNIPVTPGSGAIVASDDIDGVQYQRVKLSIGADGAATDAPGDSIDGWKVQAKLLANSGVDIGDVDVLSLPALPSGTNTIGKTQREDIGKTRVSGRVAVTASQTGSTVWDPTTGKKFVLTKLVYSASGAGTVQLFDSTDSGNTVLTAIMSIAANGGFVLDWPVDQPYRSAAVDNILKYTTGGGSAGSLYYEGWEE